MAGTGQFHVNGSGQITTTYSPTSEGCSQLINDFYDGGWRAFHSGFARSVGDMVFDGGYGSSGGMFNPKFGMDITAALFTSKTIFAAMPKKAYDHEGMRLLTKFGNTGTAGEVTLNGAKMFDGTHEGFPTIADTAFVGLGAGTVADGQLFDGYKMDFDMIRIPYKENPMKFNYGLGMKAMEGKDDTASYKQYVDFMRTNYDDLADKTILRAIDNVNPIVGGKETTMTGLARIFSSGEEMTVGENANKYLPWGGVNGDMAGGYYVNPGDNGPRATHSMPNGQGRAAGVEWGSDGIVTSTTHTRNNYDAQVVDAEGAVPSLGMFDDLYMRCLTNWDNDYTEKAWVMSPLMWNKLNQLCKANNIYIDSMYTTMTISGMKTNEGRDVGMALKSYMNQPIIMSGNLSFDYQNQVVDTTRYGDCFLLDLKHVWICMTTPMEVWTAENPAFTNDLLEHNVTNMRCEVRADKFISSGRIKNVGTA